MEKLKLKVRYLNEKCKLRKEKKGDWIDVRAAREYHYAAGDVLVIPLGFAMKLPEGYEAHVAPRGSSFKNFGFIQTNSVGIIDETYCGNDDQWFMPVLAMKSGHVYVGDRVGQFRIVEKMPEVDFDEVDTLEDENRGGYGSTGVK